MKTNLKDFSLTPLGKVQPRATMAPFGYVLWMLVLLLGGGAFEVKAAAFTSCAAVTEIPVLECNALVALYDGTGGATWSDSTGWKTTDTPCSWIGITCSAGGPPRNITGIYRISKNLAGTLPTSLKDLGQLQSLYLSNNKLTGTIPVLPGELEYIDLSNNQLTGGILPNTPFVSPAELYLKELNLAHNLLAGLVPDFVDLNTLTKLYLNNNRFTGTLPDFQGLIGLNELNLSSNQLDGTILNFTKFDNLTTLDLSNNQFSGSSPNFYKINSLKYLYLSNNQLTGAIPDFTVGPGGTTNTKLVRLKALHLDHNRFSGEIPASITGLPILSPQLPEIYLSLWYNQLTTMDPSVINFLDLHDPDWRIQTSSLPVFTSIPLSNFTEIGKSYSYNITAQWSSKLTITATTKPTWLTVTDNGNNTAILTGTPSNSDVGTHPVVLQIKDSQQTQTATQSFNLEVLTVGGLIKPYITSVPTTFAFLGINYTYEVKADGTAPLTFTAPTKLTWLTLKDNGNNTATLQGTPTQANNYPVTLQVKDSNGITNTQSFNIQVNPVVLTDFVTTSPPTTTTVGQTYSYNIVVQGSNLTLTAPTKPAWLTFTSQMGNNTAILTGTPTSCDEAKNNPHNVSLELKDNQGTTKQQTFAINVVENSSCLPDFYSLTLTTTPPAILKGSKVNVTGQLISQTGSVAGVKISLTLTAPDNTTQTLSSTTNGTGEYQVEVTGLDQAGKYTLIASFEDTQTAKTPDASEVATLNVVESGIILSEIILPQNNAQFDQQLPMIAGYATDNQQGTWIERVELTLQDQTTAQYWNFNSNTTSPTPVWIPAQAKTDWFVETDQVTWVPGHSYLITARAVDLTGVVSAEKTAQFTIGMEIMPTALSLNLSTDTLSPPENSIEITGTFTYTQITTLPVPDLSKLVIRWELEAPDKNKTNGQTSLQADGTFLFTLSDLNPIAGGSDSYTLQVFFDGNADLQPAEAKPKIITVVNNKLKILHPANGSTVKTLPWISGQVYDPKIKEVKIAVKLNRPDDKGNYKYLKLDNLGGHFEVVANDQPIWIPAIGLSPWVVNVSKVILIDQQTYTIKAQGFDDGVPPQLIDETRPTEFTFDIDRDVQAFTSLALRLQSPTLLIGEPLNLTGKLDRHPYEGQDLAGRHLEVTIESPDQKITSIEVKTQDPEGHFALTDIAVFDREGSYRINAYFAGDAVLSPAISEPQRLLVGQTAGYAILVQGKIANSEDAHVKTVNRIYQQLKDRGLNDDNIYYFGYDPKKPFGLDDQPSKAEIETVFNNLKDRLNKVPAALYVILVDHGGVGGKFYLNGTEEITSENLAGWLQSLEDGLTNELAKQQPRVVILGACYSGSFIRPLSKNGRIIITSVAENEVSYKGPVEPIDGIRTGELFVQELFDALGRDLSVAKAFEKAADTLRVYTRSGTSVLNGRFYDSAVQHPLLDDNGDKIGSNSLYQDGRKAAGVYLGVNRVSRTRVTADISKVSASIVLAPQENTFKPSLEVINAGRIKIATMDIRGPNEKLLKENKEQTEQAQIKQLPRVFLSCPKDTVLGTTTCYTTTQSLSQFDTPGKYDIFYFVNDLDPNYVSPLWHSVVYKAKEGNNPPTVAKLLKPANEGKAQTTLMFDWEDAADEEGDAISYILQVAQDIEFKHLVYQQEEMRFSQSYIDGNTKVNVWNNNALGPTEQFGLKDQTDYYWKVIAVDNYGAQSPASEVFKFRTDNPNAPFDCEGSGTPKDSTNTPDVTPSNNLAQDDILCFIKIDIITDISTGPGQIEFINNFPTTVIEGAEIKLVVGRKEGNQGKMTVDYLLAGDIPNVPTVGTLNWEDTDMDPKPIPMHISDDSIISNDQRAFTITLSNLTVNGQNVDPNWKIEHTVTIMEDDYPLVGIIQFGTPLLEVKENVGSVKLVVKRVGGKEGAVSVNWSASSNGQEIHQGPLDWAPDDKADKEIVLPILDMPEDQLIEVTLEGELALLGEPKNASVTVKNIINDPLQGTLQFAPTTLETREGYAPLIINVNRVSGTAGEVSVEYRVMTENSTAQLDKDFRLEGTLLLFWPAGDATSKQITLEPYNEGETEGDETVTLQLYNVTGGANLGMDMVTVTIKDGGTGPGSGGELDGCDKNSTKIQFFAPLLLSKVSENIGPMTFTVTRTDCYNGKISVEYEVTPDSTATLDSDYTGASTGQLTWVDQENQPKTFTLTLVNDTVLEPEEEIKLRLTGENLGEPQMVSLVVEDDDDVEPPPPPPTVKSVNVKFTLAEYQVTEGEVEYIDIPVTITRLDNLPVEAAAVVCHRGDVQEPKLLEWLAQETVVKNCRVQIADDNVNTGDREIMLSLSNPYHTTQIVEPATAKLLIKEDDVPCTPHFTTNDVTVTEADKEIVLTIECAGGADGEVTTNYQTENGTALDSEDYQSSRGTLTFTQDHTSDTVKILLVNDEFKEVDEQLVVKLSPPDNGQVTITIKDDDDDLPVLGCIATDNTGGPLNLDPEIARCKGGISVEGQEFIDKTIITLDQKVNVVGRMTVNPQHVGQEAELVLFAGYRPLVETDAPETFFMLDTTGAISIWSHEVSELKAWQAAKPLEPMFAVTLYEGQFILPGRLTVFFGYRLADGTVVQNDRSIEVQIDE